MVCRLCSKTRLLPTLSQPKQACSCIFHVRLLGLQERKEKHLQNSTAAAKHLGSNSRKLGCLHHLGHLHPLSLGFQRREGGLRDPQAHPCDTHTA